MSLYAQVYALDVDVGENYLEVSYPQGNASSTFSFLVGTNGWGGKRNVQSWEDVEGVKVNVSGTVDLEYEVQFAGLRGGKGKVINDFEFWNVTYGMAEGSVEVPRVRLEFETV